VSSEVYFLPFKGRGSRSLLEGVGKLLDLLGLKEKVGQGELWALKVHFGEEGNHTYLRPDLVRPVVDYLRALGALPFLTDTTTLYKGSRSDGVRHLETAIRHGFGLLAPVVIADGLRGDDVVRVAVKGKIYQEVEVAKAIYDAHGLLVLSHFKGHDLSGFGGALKNLGMGCTGKRGKMSQHAEVAPKVLVKKCKGCGRCVGECPASALRLEGQKALLEGERCIGCGQCIAMCPEKAIEVSWKRDPGTFQRKMVEHALGVVEVKRGKVFFINFLLCVTPFCDCWSKSDRPVVQDIGLLASEDPVAVDQASVDLVNSSQGTGLLEGLGPGSDKFRALHRNVDWSVQLSYAEELGLGSRAYELKEVQ